MKKRKSNSLQRRFHCLYAVTLDGSQNLLKEVEEALAGGARIIQYRDKSSTELKRISDANAINAMCQKYLAYFIVNDDIDLAIKINADGVHIGIDDGEIVNVRKQLGDKILGVSCYNSLERALNAEQQGADYVAFGRFFTSGTKPDAVKADVELIRKAKQSLRIPVVAIGGITLSNASILINEGVDAVAVVDGLFKQSEIKKTARKFTDLFK